LIRKLYHSNKLRTSIRENGGPVKVFTKIKDAG